MKIKFVDLICFCKKLSYLKKSDLKAIKKLFCEDCDGNLE